MKDYNIRQMQKLALQYFPYGEGLLGHLARTTGEVIAAKTGLNCIDCFIKFLVFAEKNGVILSIEEARTFTNVHNDEAIMLGMLSQIFSLWKASSDEGLLREELRGPCQRYFNALFAMTAKRKIDLIEITDKKLRIYDLIK